MSASGHSRAQHQRLAPLRGVRRALVEARAELARHADARHVRGDVGGVHLVLASVARQAVERSVAGDRVDAEPEILPERPGRTAAADKRGQHAGVPAEPGVDRHVARLRRAGLGRRVRETAVRLRLAPEQVDVDIAGEAPAIEDEALKGLEVPARVARVRLPGLEVAVVLARPVDALPRRPVEDREAVEHLVDADRERAEVVPVDAARAHAVVARRRCGSCRRS